MENFQDTNVRLSDASKRYRMEFDAAKGMSFGAMASIGIAMVGLAASYVTEGQVVDLTSSLSTGTLGMLGWVTNENLQSQAYVRMNSSIRDDIDNQTNSNVIGAERLRLFDNVEQSAKGFTNKAISTLAAGIMIAACTFGGHKIGQELSGSSKISAPIILPN